MGSEEHLTSKKPKLTWYGPDTMDRECEMIDPDGHYYSRAEVDAILQAIFDPENQPSQFGTRLIEESKK